MGKIPPVQGVAGARSVSDLRNFLSPNDIYSYVKGLAPVSDMAMLAMTKQVSKHWQLGGDIRYMRTTGTDGAGDVPAQIGTGSIFAYTVQAVGTDTLFKNDTSVIMASFMNDPTYISQNISLVNSVTLHEKWRLDSSLRYYHEKRDTDSRTWKVTPGIRLNYYWRDNMSFEAEFMVDRTHTADPVSVTTTDSWRETLFAGYRWDFR